MHLLPIPPFVSVAFAALAIAFLAPSASAQGLKIIVAPELAGGEVFVEGLLHLRFVGPASTPAHADTLATTWKTYAGRAVRRVIVTQLRFAEHSAGSWRAEHLVLVARLASAFPMLTRPRTAATPAATPSNPGTHAGAELVPLAIPRARLQPHRRRVSALPLSDTSLGASHGAPWELPQPYTLIPLPKLDRDSRPS